MKKVFIFLFSITLVFFQFSCSKIKPTDNSNQTNANSGLPAETNQANSDVKTEATPLPTYTNADEALAEGKKLLDALETEKAVDALTQAVKLNPDLAEAHFNLGIAYSLLEKDEQEKIATQIEPTPIPKSAGKNKKDAAPVRTKNSEKAFENAVKAYKKILAVNPKDDAAQFNLGRAYNKLNEDEDALKALREAVKLKPDDAEYQTEYGAILIKLAQYAEAVSALKKAAALDENNIQVQELLEKAQAGQKRVEFGNEPKPLPTTQTKSRDAVKTDANVNTNSSANTATKKTETKPKTVNANK